MTINLDPAGDCAVADGLEAVTFHRRGETPGAPGVVIPSALRRVVSVKEAVQSGGHYTTSDVVWHLPVAELIEVPRLGDVIAESAGQHWTVLEVQLVALRTRWRCAARSLAVVYGLDDTITVLRADYSKGSGGAAQAAWLTWRTGVRARIQAAAVTMGSAHLARRAAKQFQVFVAEELPLDDRYRIVGPDGTTYRILGTSGAERIGELQTIQVEVTP
jgi:chitodextrinase